MEINILTQLIRPKQKTIVLALAVCVLILSIVTFFVGKHLQDQRAQFTPVVTTGAGDTGFTSNLDKATEESKNLRRSLPIDTSAYSVRFDYKTVKFIVTLHEPYDENKKAFVQFLEQQGYESVSTDQVTFVLQ